MDKQKSEIVRNGYSKIARTYHAKRGKYDNRRLLAKISKLLPKNAMVLDLGCGAGVPIAKTLARKGFAVTGVDFASGMVRLARKNVPKAEFLKIDITKMKFKADSFDGAVSFYALIHIPREKHAAIYRKLHRIIKPNGVMLLNACGIDTNGWEEYSEDYMGVPMFWSYYGPKKTMRLIQNAGFDVLWSRVLDIGDEKQFWILAKNKKYALGKISTRRCLGKG
jgi:ubiquinone/menaquinone biosynthesis C-methylase UbiE